VPGGRLAARWRFVLIPSARLPEPACQQHDNQNQENEPAQTAPYCRATQVETATAEQQQKNYQQNYDVHNVSPRISCGSTMSRGSPVRPIRASRCGSMKPASRHHHRPCYARAKWLAVQNDTRPDPAPTQPCLDNTDIGERLHISEKTVRNHASNLFDKLGVWSRAQAIVFARDHGFSS
jgi:hypothetical protein